MPCRRLLQPIDGRPRPRLVNTHLPLSLCPPGLLDTCKVIYVARNPKDACVSYYKMLMSDSTLSPETTIEDFVTLYNEGKMVCLPFFPNVLQAWRQRQHPNMLFLTFEEMKRDLRAVIERTAEFLGKKLTAEQLDRLQHHLSFESMRKNKWVNKEDRIKGQEGADGERLSFMRKGQTGDWKNHLSDETSQEMDRWMEENLHGTGLTFVAEARQQ
ncbi:sulfotransferase family cytosolic 1B member 1-like [Pollicipes pollicipes]|uniref:sulfotransferase family cytosolic 1B member 1-like n=1 Tax=Pollicipes pollicipes TaxID=41117 RepID=UPI0018854700|nr:sulfotransferase family cytosolic 1B member 1-like [Pollicipes pollicipes]